MKHTILASREASPARVSNGNGYVNGTSSREEYSTINGNSHSHEGIQNGHSSDQHSDDEYIDTVEVKIRDSMFNSPILLGSMLQVQ